MKKEPKNLQPISKSLANSKILDAQNKTPRNSVKNSIWSAERPEQTDFPGGAVVKNPPANAGDASLSPGQGRSHMPRNN